MNEETIEQTEQATAEAEVVDTSGIRVFVYGTLKEGYCNHDALKDGGAQLLGKCRIEGEFALLDLGFYPAVVPDSGAGDRQVYGEVYLVDEDTLHTLDCIEGHPSYYTRFKVETPWKKAWVYMLPEDYLDKGYGRVVDGNWTGGYREAIDIG